MTTPRRQCDDSLTVGKNTDLILDDGCQIAVTFSAAKETGNSLIVPQFLEAAA